MKYAVIYQSESGNTKLLAEKIYQTIDNNNKVLYNLDQMEELPKADVYFIGFGVHNNLCGVDLLDLFEDLNEHEAKYALFATCGYLPNEQYKNTLMKNLEVWLPESGSMVDMFLCQGKVEQERQDIMISQTPDMETKIRKMFDIGSTHPDSEDLDNAAEFARKVQAEVEDGDSITIW